MKTLLSFIIFLIFFTVCDLYGQIVNIYIHGTILKFPFISKIQEPARLEKFCPTQVNCCKYSKIAQNIINSDEIKFDPEHFYILKWPGSIGAEERVYSAYRLYYAIKNLNKKYLEKYGALPKIRLIAHSNGGNVALNLPYIADLLGEKNPFYIDECVILACPMQIAPAAYAADKMFKHVYSIYSTLDFVQIIAPQSSHDHHRMGRNVESLKRRKGPAPLFSARKLPKSANLVQAKIRIKGRGLAHCAFNKPVFLNRLPFMIDLLERHHRRPFLPERNGIALLNID